MIYTHTHTGVLVVIPRGGKDGGCIIWRREAELQCTTTRVVHSYLDNTIITT